MGPDKWKGMSAISCVEKEKFFDKIRSGMNSRLIASRLIPLIATKMNTRGKQTRKVNVMVATLMTQQHVPPVEFFVFRPPGSIYREGSAPKRVLSGHCIRC